MHTGPASEMVDPDIAKLATIGMRVRHAVANGYNRPQDKGVDMSNSSNQPTGMYNNSYQVGSLNRVPLPGHMDGPPGLTNLGSTAGTSSNLSEWENNSSPNLVTILNPNISLGKRKFDDIQNSNALPNSLSNINDYDLRYGELRFDEDF